MLGGTGLIKDVNAQYKDGGNNAKWIVHPAFSFGDSTTDYSANTQLSGIWIAKFCASSSNPNAKTTVDSTQYYYGGGNSTSLKVMSVPGVYSWRYITLANVWTNVNEMTNGGAVVAATGITTNANVSIMPSSFIDTHPAKMMEWSAISILSQSAYGIFNPVSSTGYASGANQSITYEGNLGATLTTDKPQVWNNSRECYTGYAGSTKDGNSESKNDDYKYNTINGIKASTTGTVYGVYDMSGCAYEFVMGIYGSNGTTPYSNSYTPTWSGIQARYYNLYTYSSSADTTLKRVQATGLIGDLTYETYNGTNNWGSDESYFVYTSRPIFLRAGGYNYSTIPGVFAFGNGSCNTSASISFRPVLISV